MKLETLIPSSKQFSQLSYEDLQALVLKRRQARRAHIVSSTPQTKKPSSTKLPTIRAPKPKLNLDDLTKLFGG